MGQGLKVGGVVAMALGALSPMRALHPMPPPQPHVSPLWKRAASL